MSLSRLAYASSARPSFNASDPPAMAPHRHGHAHFWERALSRRQVVRTAAGLAIAGVAGPAVSARAQETMSGTPVVLPAGAAPKPIPGGIDLGGGNIIHVYDYSQGWDPSTITDFRGLVGIHHMRGEGTVTVGGGSPLGTPTATSDRLSYDTDMRFMQGTYIGEDGQAREGTFAFIWLDLLVGAVAPDFSNQIHDFNPGIAESGLFWTIPVPDDMVRVDLGAGTAEMHAEGIEVLDQYSFASALSGGPQEPATVSFDIWWHTPTAVEQLRDETLGFAATLLDVTSTIAFTARTANFEFVSDPPESGTSLFARIGFDANGVFLPPASAPGQATPTS